MPGRLPRLPGVVASVDTAGEGGIWGVTIFNPQATGTAQVSSTVNLVRVVQFVLPFRISVGKFSFEVTTAANPSNTGCGIYDKDKNRVITSGAVDTAGTGLKRITLSSPVTLEPGVYWLAWTSDKTAVQTRHIISGSGIGTILNEGSVELMGTAANDSSAGVLPATLGTITAAALNVFAAFFKSA